MGPALAALARLLPFLEGMAAEGGGAALGGAAAEGGMLGSIGRLFGSSAFASEAELGAGLRKISDLSAAVESARQAMAQNQQQQHDVAGKARDDERQFAFSDPAHTAQLAQLARSHQQQAEEMARSQRQMNDLRTRAALTTNPAAAQAASLGRLGTAVGVGAAVASLAPTILRNAPPVVIGSNLAQAGANMAGNFVGQPQGAIAGQMAGFAANTLGRANPLSLAGSVLSRGPMGPLEELSKVSVEVAKLPGHLMAWSNSLVDSQRAIARFSPVLSRMVAENERREIVRGARSAQVTGGATSELSDAMQDLQDLLQPVRDTVTVALARGLTVGIQLIGEGVKHLASIWEVVKKLPVAKDVDALMKAMEEGSRLDAAIRMRPLLTAMRDLDKRDPSKPKAPARH